MLSPRISHTKLSEIIDEENNKKCINNEYKEYDFENLNTNNINDTNELNRICSELYINDNLDYRIYILNNLYKYHNELCLEHFYKINVQYLYNPEVELNELMLIKIIKESQLSIEMKYECAKLIYFENKENKENKENIGYDLMLDMLTNNSSKLENNEHIIKFSKKIHSLLRIQMIQYLIESTKNIEKVNNVLYEFLTDKELEEYYKYQNVLNLSENPNTQKEYIKEMFKIICLSKTFRTRYIILASQFFLGITSSEKEELFNIEEKLEVENIIVSFCQDSQLDYNLRADAADLLLTQGITERARQIALDTIVMLGRDGYNNKISIYNDKQNVHNISIEESVKNIIIYLASINLETKDGVYITYDDVCKEIISEYCILNQIEQNENNIKFKDLDDTTTSKEYTDDNDTDDYFISNNKTDLDLIKASLLRFSLDRGLYSNYQSIQSLFIKIWQIIKSHEYSETLTQRLFEELIEMSGSCSSGHVSRLVNVLSGFEINGKMINLSIDYKDEITSIMMAKINKKISEIGLSGKEEDEEYQNKILEEMLWTSNFERRTNFNRFFRENVIEIRDELFKEYVTEQKLMDTEIFEINFRSVLEKFEY